MRRSSIVAFVTTLMFAALAALEGPAQAKAPGPDGRIVFSRQVLEVSVHRVEVFKRYAYTANPDGSDVQRLTPNPLCTAELPRGQCTAEFARWSPDGAEISILADVCGALNCAAFLVDPDTGVARTIPQPDPALDLACGSAWSPDGSRLACTVFNEFGGGDPTLDGVSTIRASDGGGVARVTDFPALVGDYSPDGTRLVIDVPPDSENSHLSVVKFQGGGVRKITPRGLSIGSPGEGSWSPDGQWILFSAVRDFETHRIGLWAVHPDGSGLHRFPIPRCGGVRADPASLGCLRPHWSPNGTEIIFDAFDHLGFHHVYTANADGSGLTQVTASGLEDYDPDWGPHPISTLG
jgi:Tol biopolymer transport system component